MPQRDLPYWRSPRRIQAAPIIATAPHPEGCVVVVDIGDGQRRSIVVTPASFLRYTPALGDYLLLFPGGKAAVCPRRAFLDNYEPIETHAGFPGEASD